VYCKATFAGNNNRINKRTNDNVCIFKIFNARLIFALLLHGKQLIALESHLFSIVIDDTDTFKKRFRFSKRNLVFDKVLKHEEKVQDRVLYC
jgi:hypothetical protein